MNMLGKTTTLRQQCNSQYLQAVLPLRAYLVLLFTQKLCSAHTQAWPVVPTNEGQVCSLSLRSAVISADLLEEPVRALLVRAGARTLLTGLFDEDTTTATSAAATDITAATATAGAAATAGLTPAQRAAVTVKVQQQQQQQQRSPLVPPPELFRYVRQPLRAGVLATLDTARRNAKDTFEALLKGAPAAERAALRALLCREPLVELVKEQLAIAKELPVLPLCARGTILLDAVAKEQPAAHAAAVPKQLFMVLEGGCGASSSALLEQFLEQQQWAAVAKLVGQDVYLMTPRFIKVDSDRYLLLTVLALFFSQAVYVPLGVSTFTSSSDYQCSAISLHMVLEETT
jgi:hypothetical protein